MSACVINDLLTNDFQCTEEISSDLKQKVEVYEGENVEPHSICQSFIFDLSSCPTGYYRFIRLIILLDRLGFVRLFDSSH